MNSVPNIYYLVGERNAADFIERSLLQKFLSECNNVYVQNIAITPDNFDQSSIIRLIKSNDFFDTAKFIIVTDPTKEQLTFFDKIIDDIVNQSTVRLVIKNTSPKVSHESKVVKFCSEKNTLIFLNPPIDQYGKINKMVVEDIKTWFCATISCYGIEIDDDATDYILESMGYDRNKLSYAIGQLKTLKYRIDLNAATSLFKDVSEKNLFLFIEYLYNGNIEECFAYINDFIFEKQTDTFFLLEFIISRIKFLCLVKDYVIKTQSEDENAIINAINSDISIINNEYSVISYKIPHPYVVKLAIKNCSNIDYLKLKKIYDYLYSIYEEMRRCHLDKRDLYHKLCQFVLFYSGISDKIII